MDKMNKLLKYLLAWIGLSSSILLIDWSPRDQLMALCLLASVLSLSVPSAVSLSLTFLIGV